MCNECRMSHCPGGCPNFVPVAAEICDECGGDICAGEEYYDFDGVIVCYDCLRDYLKQFKKEAQELGPDYDGRDD